MKSSTNSSFHSDLRQVFGITVRDQNQYTQCGPHLALVAGSNIIIYDPQTNQQFKFINHSSSNISCIAATLDGKKLAVGEPIKGSSISVYEITQARTISKPKYLVKGHKYGVSMMCWSPNGKYLITVSNEDGGMFVWEETSRISQNKMGRKINKMIFTQEGNLVTVGKQHFKIWYFDKGNIMRTQTNDCWMMEGKGIIVGKMLLDKEFVNTAQKNGKFVALSSDGILCVVHAGAIDKVVDVKLVQPKGLAIYQKWAICGGENATIKVIDIDTLQLISVFAKPSVINQENPTVDQKFQEQGTYHDCIGLRTLGKYVVALYRHASIFLWQIADSKVKAYRCFLGHSQEIVCLELLQQIHNQISFFATSGKDMTIRVWHIYDQYFDNKKSIDIAEAIGVKRNTYCKYLTHIIHCEQVIQHIKSTNALLIGASTKTVYVYSLSSFSLLYQLPLQNLTIDAIQAHNNQLTVGLSNKTIKIFSVSQTMLKAVKIIDTKLKIEQIRLWNRNMVVFSKGSFIVVDLDADTVFKEQKDVDAIDLVQGKQLYYLRKDKLHVYSLTKKKEKEPTLLQSDTFGLQCRLRVISRFILVASHQQNSGFLQVWSHEGFLVHEQTFNESINDVSLCEDGNCIIATKSGCLIVQEFTYREVFTKIQRQFKRWFEENDLSWTAGSVWISQDLKNKKYSNADDLLQSINEPPIKEIPDKILTDSLAMSSKGENISNVNIAYRRNDQRVSIFNPSAISDQANKIIANVNNLQKKFQVKNSPSSYLDSKSKTINLDDPFEDIKLSGQSKLVESVMHEYQPKMNNFLTSQQGEPEEMLLSQKIGVAEKIGMTEKQQTPQQSLDKLYSIMTGDSHAKSLFVHSNQEKLKAIYQNLHSYFGSSQSQATANAIQTLSSNYLADLKTLLNQL